MNIRSQLSRSVQMDFSVIPFDFASTEVRIQANTKSAKDFFANKFGIGCVSINVPKSVAQNAIDKIEAEGFSVNLI